LRFVFFIPAVLLLLIFVAGPVVYTAVLSFTSPDGEFVGFDNYASILADRDTVNLEGFPKPPPLGTLIHNLLWILIHLPLSLFAGLWLAITLREVKGASIVKSAIFLGMVTPMIVGGVVLRFLFEGGVGLVPSFFGLIGLEGLNINWMQHPQTLLFGLIFGSVWLWTGFSLIVYSAGLTTIPREYFEAAKIDGTPPFRTFFRITFPLLMPMTLTIVTMTIFWELKIFDIVFAATNVRGGVGGAADVLALQMYRLGFVRLPPDYGSAAAVATLLTLLTLVAIVGMLRYMVRK
jgi:multiple sugar transport system permease protein